MITLNRVDSIKQIPASYTDSISSIMFLQMNNEEILKSIKDYDLKCKTLYLHKTTVYYRP